MFAGETTPGVTRPVVRTCTRLRSSYGPRTSLEPSYVLTLSSLVLSSERKTLAGSARPADIDVVRQSSSSFAPSWAPTAFVAALAATVASVGVIGGDLRSLVPLERWWRSGHVPDSVPAAAAPTVGWHTRSPARSSSCGPSTTISAGADCGGRSRRSRPPVASARRPSVCGGSRPPVGAARLRRRAARERVGGMSRRHRLSLFSLALFPLLVLRPGGRAGAGARPSGSPVRSSRSGRTSTGWCSPGSPCSPSTW